MMRYALPLTQDEPTVEDLIDSRAPSAAKTGRCPCCGRAVKLVGSLHIGGLHYRHDMPNIFCRYNTRVLPTEEERNG